MSRLSVLVATIYLVAWLPGALTAEKPYLSYPQAARDKYQEAERLVEQRRYDLAIAAYEDAMRLGLSDYPRVRLRLAECSRLNKDYARAVAQYTGFLEEIGLERSCPL